MFTGISVGFVGNGESRVTPSRTDCCKTLVEGHTATGPPACAERHTPQRIGAAHLVWSRHQTQVLFTWSCGGGGPQQQLLHLVAASRQKRWLSIISWEARGDLADLDTPQETET
ncbi:hypothetical protein AGIG_G10304 [Arapaima gigas]